MLRTIMSPAGIGDNIWLIMKLINQPEKFHWQITNKFPQRTKPLFDLLPQIAESCEYVEGLSYETVDKYNITSHFPTWNTIAEKKFFLSINRHLEEGKRIEEFLPDLPTAFKLTYDSAEFESEVSRDINGVLMLRANYARPLIGIYGSSYSTSRSWGFWQEKEWFSLIQKIHAERPDVIFCVIGAAFDVDLGDPLAKLLRVNNIPCLNTLSKPLGYVVELLKRLNYFVGFPSGLSILNETLGRDTFMFYPEHLKKMMPAWADPKRIESKNYIAQLFCDPQEAFDIIKNEYCLFDKI